MTVWEKTYTWAMMPLMLILAFLEPIWIEVKRAYTDGEIIKNWKDNFKQFYQIYRYDIWE